MFKSEYQGGPFVDVFSAQGRDPLSKKCKVTGTSSNVHKQYEKDVKSYVYVLEGEPTTTKIQFPKEDKHGLFLTQKFLVFQIFLPVGRPFSFEVTVTDHTQNKRRIFFSSNIKDVSVTPLHAKFPLTILNPGSWLNMCLDVESLVSETFNGPKFRTMESFTVTANCKLKRVFTLRAPPVEDNNPLPNSEPLPRNLQLITTSDVSNITQILSYTTLCGISDSKNPTTPVTPSDHEGPTPRHDQETHIAFGTKVIKPPHLRRNSLKENRESNKIPSNSRAYSSKSKQGESTNDIRLTNNNLKSPLSQRGNPDFQNGSSDAAPNGIDVNQAAMQPRPPRTSSAGKIRRPIRLKSGGKKTAGENTDEKQCDKLGSEEISNVRKSRLEFNEKLPENSDSFKASEVNASLVNEVENKITSSSQTRLPTKGSIRDIKAVEIKKDKDELPVKNSLENATENDAISETDFVSKEAPLNDLFNGNGKSSHKDLGQLTNEIHDTTDNSEKLADKQQVSNNVANGIITDKNKKTIDMNNNDPLIDNDADQPRTRPRKLPLASNNPVFTFASMPRSPRSGKRKLLESPMVDDVTTPIVEVPPEVMVSLAEDVILKNPEKDGGQRNRGVSLEDDFCKLSDDDNNDEQDADGIQKLLQSSLSPRHSPMPFHQQLRQSIRSSMLKEIPSPIKENGYDAQNYQSDNHHDTLNQSTASSWRFDTSDSSNSFNQTQQDLEDSLNDSSLPKGVRLLADIPMIDEDDDCQSDCSDDTTYSTWKEPPQELRGNKYQNEMKPPGQEPDLTATICMDPRDYCDVFSPPIMLGTPNKENNIGISNLSPMKSPQKVPTSGNQQEEEELDLLYDPCLNCYFDPKTHKYYELA